MFYFAIRLLSPNLLTHFCNLIKSIECIIVQNSDGILFVVWQSNVFVISLLTVLLNYMNECMNELYKLYVVHVSLNG